MPRRTSLAREDRENDRAFRNDADYPLLCSLEVVDEDGDVKKADMFYKQTIKPKIVIERVETAVEALNVSMNEYGAVNIPFMLSIYHPSLTKAMAELPPDKAIAGRYPTCPAGRVFTITASFTDNRGMAPVWEPGWPGLFSCNRRPPVSLTFPKEVV
jgi:hypothetical protein